MKLREITPEHMRCIIGSCPAIYETNRGTYILIGHKLNLKKIDSNLKNKISSHENAIEVPQELLKNISLSL